VPKLLVRCIAACALTWPVLVLGWSEYRSSNFVIFSDMRPAAAETMLGEFEQFRIATLAITGLPARPENSRMQIVLFGRARDFDAFRPHRNVAAFYADTMAGPRMVIGAQGRPRDIRSYLFHEYVHYLLRDRSELQYPMWYDEGFAELLASAEVRSDGVRIGRMEQQHHLWWLQHHPVLPVAELLDPRPPRGREDRTPFYASAWLFTHYLQLGQHRGERNLRPLMREYLRRLDANQNPVTLFEEVFALPVAEMDRQLRAYQQRAQYSVLAVNVPAYDGPITRVPVSAPDRAFLLGDLAFQLGHRELASRHLAGVASATEAPRALSLRAVLEHANDSAAALALLEGAVAAAPDDPRVLANAARVWYAEFERLRASGILDQPLLLRSIEYGARAKERDPDALEPNEHLWAAHALLGDTYETVRWMMDAYRLNPTSVRLNCVIGAYLSYIDEVRHAPSFLERVLAWSHDEELRARVSNLLDGGNTRRMPSEVCR
jgi:hypothetical protein